MRSSRDTGTVTRRKKKTPTTDAASGSNGSHSPTSAPEYEEIAKLAYQFWEERGRPEGSSNEDWFRAESRLLRMTT
jgi:Protein of unknown function (DUF2934)